jgi:phosphatidylglycerol lysyltransferase
VAFVRAGRFVYTSGGLLAPAGERRALLAEFVEHADRAGCVVSFFNVPEDEVAIFREAGFQVTKWGEEAIVDLAARSWQSGAFAWVRRQSNYCRRRHVAVEECHWQLLSPRNWQATIAELLAVSSVHLAMTPQRREMRLLEGRFMPEQLGRRRLFIARAENGRGRIEGFLVCNPLVNGRRFAFETYRHCCDAVRGVSAYLMHQAMIRLAEDGVESVSLCLIPGLACDKPLAGDSRMARLGLVWGTKYFGMIVDTAGMYHFKSRFRPRFEARYICVRPKITLAWSWTLIRLLGVLKLHPLLMARDALARLRKRSARKTMSAPRP